VGGLIYNCDPVILTDTSVTAATCASYTARENDLCGTKIKKKNTL